MRRALSIAVCLMLGLAACAADPSDNPALVASAGKAAVEALDNTFRDGQLTVPAGTTVTWRNVGRNDHDIRPVDDQQATQWGVGREGFAPGDTYSHQFADPGTYAYYCTIHGTAQKGMVGTIVVTAAGAPTTTAATEQAPPSTAASTSATTAATATTDATATTTSSGAAGASAAVIHVPADHPTIQQAVDAASPGALILVSPGTYHEAVNVTTDRLTIRGLDRNKTILDGQLQLQNGIRVLGAKGVTVENLTAMNYTANGFFWTGADGYHGAYLNAYRTGDYGIYAFESTHGQLDHVYAAGSPDAGIYIGACFPCDAVVDRAVSEHNGLGYSGTNAGGNLLIVNSTFRFNRAGIVPNSGSYELCYPERETTIVGNVVYSNNQSDTPAIDVALLAMGNGIIPAGGVRNTIERNLVYDHDKGGISLVPFLEQDPNDRLPTKAEWDRTCAEARDVPPQKPAGALLWNPQDTRVVGNVLSDNRQADIILASLDDVSTLGNCFSGNTMTSTAPTGLEALAPCDGTPSGDWAAAGTYDIAAWLSETHPPSIDWRTASLPTLQPQEQMPDAAAAPAHPAVDVPAKVDLAAIQVPAKPSS